jgi:hypothetical protein
LNIPLKQNTTVTLLADVPLTLPAKFNLSTSEGAANLPGSVRLSLPAGLKLPVALDLNVPVDSPLPISIPVPIDLKVPVNLTVPVHLKVPVDIPLDKTQLHDPFDKLRSLFDPFVRLLGNLPNSWNEVPDFISRVFSGNPPNLLADNRYTQKPWAGFTTGINPPAPTASTSGAGSAPGNTAATPAQVAPTLAPTTVAATPAPSGPTTEPTRVQDLGIITPTP